MCKSQNILYTVKERDKNESAKCMFACTDNPEYTVTGSLILGRLKILCSKACRPVVTKPLLSEHST